MMKRTPYKPKKERASILELPARIRILFYSIVRGLRHGLSNLLIWINKLGLMDRLYLFTSVFVLAYAVAVIACYKTTFFIYMGYGLIGLAVLYFLFIIVIEILKIFRVMNSAGLSKNHPEITEQIVKESEAKKAEAKAKVEERQQFISRLPVVLSAQYVHTDDSDKLLFYVYSSKFNLKTFKTDIAYVDKFSYTFEENAPKTLGVAFKEFIDEKRYRVKGGVDVTLISSDTVCISNKYPKDFFGTRTKKYFDSDAMEKVSPDYKNHYKIAKTKFNLNLRQDIIFACLTRKERLSFIDTTLRSARLFPSRIRPITDLMNEFHLCHENNRLNEFLVYTTNDFTVLASFIDNSLTDCFFIDEQMKVKDDKGSNVVLPFNSLKGMLMSLSWKYLHRQDMAIVKRVGFVSDSPTKFNEYSKNKNLLDLEFMDMSDIDFMTFPTNTSGGSRFKKPAEVNPLKKGFTLVETIAAFTVFIITASIFTSFSLTASSVTTRTKISSLATNYLSSVSEIFEKNHDLKAIYSLTRVSGSYKTYEDYTKVDCDGINNPSTDLKFEISGTFYLNETLAYTSVYPYFSNIEDEIAEEMPFKVNFLYSVTLINKTFYVKDSGVPYYYYTYLLRFTSISKNGEYTTNYISLKNSSGGTTNVAEFKIIDKWQDKWHDEGCPWEKIEGGKPNAS